MDGPVECAPATTADAQMEEHEALLEFVYVCPHGLIEFDRDGAVTMMNPACARLLLPVLRAGDRNAGLTNILDVLAPFAPDLRHRLAAFEDPSGQVLDGMQIHVGLRSNPARVRPGGRVRAAETTPLVLAITIMRLTPNRHMAVLADISEQVVQQRRLGEVEAWFSALAEGAAGYGFFGLDAEGRVNDWNNSAQRLFGLDAASAIGLDGDLLLTAPGEAPALSPRLSRVRDEGWQVLEGWMAGPGGSRFWGTSVVSAMQVGGEVGDASPGAFLAVVRDMTERREAAQALREALCQDHLTSLLNRRRFFELGEAEVRRAQQGGQPLAVIMVDVDHFKAVNDLYGHASGDAVLRAMSQLLRSLSRAEMDVVGRLGGEEFALLLPNRNAPAAQEVAERLRAAIAVHDMAVTARDGAGLMLRLTASFGVAELDGGQGLEALLAAADAALYAAKAAGRDCVRVSKPAGA